MSADIQSVISKLNPELLKTVIASGSGDQSPNISKSSENGNVLAYKTSFSVPSTPKHDENLFPALPVYTPAFWYGNMFHFSSPLFDLIFFYNAK